MNDTIKLYNDDCFKILNEMNQNNILVDCIICDPPYNITYDKWDKEFDIKRAIDLCFYLLKENGNFILFQGWSNVCQTKEFLDRKMPIMNWIIWDRIKGRGAKHNVVSTREDILWYCKGSSPTFNKIPSNIPKKTGGLGKKNGEENRALSNVWSDISPIVPWSKERVNHPTQKPLALLKRCVNVFSNEGDTILDFCMGSGTTGVACIQLNRNFIGIENNEEYFNIAKNRINDVKNEGL